MARRKQIARKSLKNQYKYNKQILLQWMLKQQEQNRARSFSTPILNPHQDIKKKEETGAAAVNSSPRDFVIEVQRSPPANLWNRGCSEFSPLTFRSRWEEKANQFQFRVNLSSLVPLEEQDNLHLKTMPIAFYTHHQHHQDGNDYWAAYYSRTDFSLGNLNPQEEDMNIRLFYPYDPLIHFDEDFLDAQYMTEMRCLPQHQRQLMCMFFTVLEITKASPEPRPIRVSLTLAPKEEQEWHFSMSYINSSSVSPNLIAEWVITKDLFDYITTDIASDPPSVSLKPHSLNYQILHF